MATSNEQSVVELATEANVVLKSIPMRCKNPCAASLARRRVSAADASVLLINIHQFPMPFKPFSGASRLQVPLFSIFDISFSIALRHATSSGLETDSLFEVGALQS